MGAIADIVIETYAIESALLRTQKIIATQGESAAALPVAMTQTYIAAAIDRIESAAKKIIADVAEGDMLRTQTAILRRLVKHDPVNVIGLQEQVAKRLLDAGKYVIA